MKLLICDYKKIHSYKLPKNVSGIYMIDFKYCYKNYYYDETLTLKNVSDKWFIASDGKMVINFNGNSCNQIELKENIFFGLKFADSPDFFQMYIVPDFVEYVPYSIKEMTQLIIGSTNDSSIKYNSNSLENIILDKNGIDWFINRNSCFETSTYVNLSAYDNQRLSLGDVIFINGIRIIFMGNFILVNDFSLNLNIKLNQISFESKPFTNITPVSDMEKKVKLFTDEQYFVHSPRLKTNIVEENIIIDDPPFKEQSMKTPAIVTFLSSSTIMVTSGVTLLTSLRNYASGATDFFTFAMELIAAGVMIFTSVCLPFISSKIESFSSWRKERKRKKKYLNYLKEKTNLIQEIIKKQEEILRLSYASIEQIEYNIANNSSEIWSREIVDDDFLSIMIGVGNIPAKINIQASSKRFTMDEDALLEKVYEIASTDYELKDVPIGFSITENNIMPVIIDFKYSDEYIKSLMLQIIYYHSGRDLKIVTITDENNAYKWEFMKYLPHSWDNKHEKRFFVSNSDELTQVSLILDQEFVKRTSQASSSGKDAYKLFDEYYLIVTDNFKLAREMSIVEKMLECDGNIGFSLIVFADSLKNLPSRFNSLINIHDDLSCIVTKNIDNNNSQKIFTPIFKENFNIDVSARKISNIPLEIKSADSAVPSSLTFLEMFKAGRIDQLNIKSRWHTNNPTMTLKSIIGFQENDKPVELDLHEKYHGPHGLIAGSTGSGKSEFIITYILSMAVNYHPYEVQFILIDYKGGGLAGAFENRDTGIRIPHLVGTITNLDKSEMGRTLVSINSELQRRQRVFNETREKLEEGTIDIYKYQRFYREGKVNEPMAHLFIISDEFAELKAQQPDFMDELVSAARIGRSLGVHLILATQKPTGVVDDQIWSNTRFRVCLKVQTVDDSNEMLKRPEAAYIKESGRFYLQVGNDEIFEMGQSGWAGAKYIPADTAERKLNDGISFLSNSGEILREINEEIKKDDLTDHGEQLTNIVKYLYDIAVHEKLRFSSLWLPNIPEVIYYNNIIKKYNLKSVPYYIDPIIGEYDDPSNQRQGFVDLPLSSCGNTYIVGTSGSGKSTLLSTIVYSTIINHNSDEVNIYIIDLGAEKLKVFQKAPQVGEVLTSADVDKIKFLFYMLKDERDKRFSYYSQNGGDFAKDVRNQKCPFPTILVFINDVDVFKEMFGDLFEYDFGPFTRNCSKVGIILIVSSVSSSSLGYIAESNFPKKIMLNMLDASEYSDFLGTKIIPKKNSGRGIIDMGQPYEFQSALIFEENLYDKQLNYILTQLDKYLTKKAKQVPVIPDEISIEMLKGRISTISSVPLGVDIKTAQICSFNFDKLLNVITSKNHTSAKKFFPKFIQIIEEIANLKIMIINSIKDLKFEVSDKVKYFDSNYKNVLSVISKNVEKYKNEAKDDKFIIIFLGYSQLQRTLQKEQKDDKTISTIDDIVYNSRELTNFKYIIYDAEEPLEKIGDGLIDSLFKRKYGIWLGKEYDSQSTFESIDTYDDTILANNNLTIIDNGNKKYVKFD